MTTNTAARRILPMNRNWLFGGPSRPGAMNANFDDSGFTKVTLPHANAVLPWHSFDESAYTFVSIYRRHFRLPETLRGMRIFADFEGAMTATKAALNGQPLGEYLGGYTPFSFELTPHLNWTGDNVLAAEVDSTERPDIPPFGGNIDFLTFGGIYREVSLRAVPPSHIADVFVQTFDCLSRPRLEVLCSIVPDGRGGTLRVELRRRGETLCAATRAYDPDASEIAVGLDDIQGVELWSPDKPVLYDLVCRLMPDGAPEDEYETRFGFREARFTPDGFMLNGAPLKIRGLNRHQTYPYTSGAMPRRVQRRDAQILKHELKVNLVRTSHYPQSRHFLDACDELGLLVLEEIPGWQHIGDGPWQDIAVRNVEEMIRRDRNRPSVVLWGVRINESQDSHDFYLRTNEAARRLDPTRQTGGIRYIYDSERLEDVFTMNDFDFPLRPPNHPLYLNTEFNGHMFSTKRFDQVERVAEHVLRHARVHNQLASDARYAGGIGWCAFDYNTHANFGSGDRICHHGVSDIFRIPKAAAGFYRSQCDPAEEVVLEPGFHWSSGDRSGAAGLGIVPVCSNCERLEYFIGGEKRGEALPSKDYGYLRHPPFLIDLGNLPLSPWGDLRIDGYIGGKKVISRTLSGRGVDARLAVEPDDLLLDGDGVDMTRVVLRVTDEFGNTRPFATGAISLAIDGPGEIVGENPFALAGGAGAVWIRAAFGAGAVTLVARHPYLGEQRVSLRVAAAAGEDI